MVVCVPDVPYPVFPTCCLIPVDLSITSVSPISIHSAASERTNPGVVIEDDDADVILVADDDVGRAASENGDAGMVERSDVAMPPSSHRSVLEDDQTVDEDAVWMAAVAAMSPLAPSPPPSPDGADDGSGENDIATLVSQMQWRADNLELLVQLDTVMDRVDDSSSDCAE